jgi:hypothetical protein
MKNHGGGPKDVWVRRYRRWRHGKLEWVRDALRSNNPLAPHGDMDDQLSLDL